MAGRTEEMPRNYSAATLSSNFKSVDRGTKATWGNRFVRDYNDLDYDASPQSIVQRLKQAAAKKGKGGGGKGPTPSKDQGSQQELLKYKYTPFKDRAVSTSHSTRNLKEGLNPQNYLTGIKALQDKLRTSSPVPPSKPPTSLDYYPQDHHLPNPQAFQGQTNPRSNLYGLSPFQYNQTLKGKMELRANHHLDFHKNKTNKINNINRVWYGDSPQETLNAQFTYRNDPHEKIHSFKSDSAHQLFHKTKRQLEDNGSGNGGMLDKFYNTMSPQTYRATHENTLTHNPNYGKMTARPDLPRKPGTNLDYKTQALRTLGQGDGKRPLMERSCSPRQLVFGRQVINPSRGCYR